VGDESAGNRLALLDALERDLVRVYAGTRPEHPLLRRLVPTVAACRLSDEPFRRLIAANRQDQHVTRYARYADLRAYCALSAEPVGRLVLQVFGVATPERVAWSDEICAALQLAEHWQDVAEDHRNGRVYLPQEDLRRFGVDEAALAARRAGPALRRLLRFEVDRSRELLRAGEALVATLRGPARRAVAGFAAGGHAALDGVARRGYDVLAGTPRTRRRDVLRHGLRLWRHGPGR
jgi:squalene synthase HpnC